MNIKKSTFFYGEERYSMLHSTKYLEKLFNLKSKKIKN